MRPASGHRRDEGGTQRDLGLAEADIADDEPVHRACPRSRSPSTSLIARSWSSVSS
jgi:hypothetical protein